MEKDRVIRLLNKLINAGYRDDKAVLGITMDKLDTIPSLSISEIKGIVELQKAIKGNAVIAFIAGPGKREGEKESGG